jgi:asparagine synthase (glutamine-hydrolysing)
MCGILGFASSDSKSSEIDFEVLANTLHHRGPDEYGEYRDSDVSLGIRRLSIIDVTHGHQPIFSEDKSVISVFNGQIYNFRELRYILETKGHKFNSDSDGEIIPHLYEEFGTNFINKIEGMFAIAIWDKGSKELHLFRDRFGKKPLIYKTFSNGNIYFASELKTLYQIGKPRISDVNINSIATYLAFGFTSNPKTIINGVNKIAPGEHLKWKNGKTTLRKYWTLGITKNTNSLSENVEQAEILIQNAVRKRLISERPLGAFLSGGIDSSLVVAMMSPYVENLKTFSVGFSEVDYDESCYAKMVVDRYKTEHTRITFSNAEILNCLTESMKFYDEPFGDSSSIPTFLLSKIASQSVTVALSGDGGDEAFGGYQRYVLYKKFARYSYLLYLARALRDKKMLPNQLFPTKVTRGMDSVPDEYSKTGMYEAMMTIIGATTRESLFRPEFKNSSNFPHLEFFEKINCSRKIPDSLSVNIHDINSYLPDDLMYKVDIASMAHSLEVRSPFLDPDVVEFGLSLPENQRVGKFGKILLRKLALEYLPSDLIHRPKMGFGIPRKEWLGGVLSPIVNDVIFDRTSLIYNWLDFESVNKVLSCHKARNNLDGAVWSILILELWAREWLN